MIATYIHNIATRYASGIAREHSYRGDLQTLLEALNPGVLVTNEPARIACGAPDYILTRDTIPVGYIEAKDLGAPLAKIDASEQLTRYKASLDNLILTNYTEFWFYRDGQKVDALAIADIRDGRLIPLPEAHDRFTRLMHEFCLHVGPTITSAQKLAEMMAAKARLMQAVIASALTSDEHNDQNSTLHAQLKAFQKILIHDITPAEFADLYAQTLAYGMFAARLHDPSLSTFTRREAAELIPKTNPFLRKLFNYIAGVDIDTRLVWIVDALADIFRAADVAAILTNFGKTAHTHDPIIHFYETFLAAYNPKLRKSRGVWYTPEPVVNFIVRAVDELLNTEFGLPRGLADTAKTTIELDTQLEDRRSKTGYKREKREVHKVQILDPAAGTGTFLAAVVRQIHQKFQGQQGIWSHYVEQHLVPRLHGFEILMASYAMAHLKLELLLRETGYTPQTPQRLRVFLTNSLEEAHPDTGTLWAVWLSQEAAEANAVKRDAPVMVVLGNPPYSGHSANKSAWMNQLLQDYKQEPGGGKLQEKNPKWLNDDYVKFIRYGQYFVAKNGEGVLAFINNHSFLDNPTFRGMRWHLLTTFDTIYILDLHGNAKKKEVAPDGSPDQNVFDIQQGVSINLFVKTGRKRANQFARVYHYDVYGQREAKYAFLAGNSLQSIGFQELEPPAPHYFFVQKDFELQKKYDNGFAVNELFPVNSVGIVTARDDFTIHATRDQIRQTIEEFLSLEDEDARQRFRLGKDVRDWKVRYAREDLLKTGPDFTRITPIAYRPFDTRFTYYTGKSKGFHCMPRGKVMQHFLQGENVGLVIGRQGQVVGAMPWNLSFVSKFITDFNLYYRGGGMIFPLYLYPEESAQQTLDGRQERQPNLNMEIVARIAERLGLRVTAEQTERDGTFAPIDILDYIYAVLHSPTYRDTYKEFLKIDFPRVPYPKDRDTFWQLVNLGGELRRLHLLEHPAVSQFITTYPQDGDNTITRRITRQDYEPQPGTPAGKVWINDRQYFDHVPRRAWDFYIGGYQPARKWLKDRRGRALDFDDILHYQKIIVALTETDRLMHAIDQIGFLE